MNQTTHVSPFAKLHPLSLGATRWTAGGFWGDRASQCRDTMVPSMGKLLTETERARFLGNFEVACGLVEGKHRGPKWNDGDFYKWLEAAAATLGTREGEAPAEPGINRASGSAGASPSLIALDRQLDRIVDLIARTQANDGYIHTDVQIEQRHGKETPRFGNPMDFEMYNMGHLIIAGIIHKRATGKTNLFSRGVHAADFLAKTFDQPTPDMARHGICPIHLSALVELYREIHDKKYLDLAVKLLNMRDLVTQGDDDNQDRIPFRQQRQAIGHAVRATYLYAGAADIYAETGDVTLMEPMQSIWQDLVSRKLYITGGCGALYDGASPDGAIDQTQITRVHQAFGRDFQLPHSTSHNETCAAIGNLLWNWRMLQITGESRFADVVELTLFNSVLAGMDLEGTSFFYTNTLRQIDPMPVELRWPRTRQKFMSCFCCPPNVVRTIAQSQQYAYASSPRGVHIVLYGSSRLATPEVELKQETDYPWDGRIRIAIEKPPAGEFSLFLRIPQWASGATVDGASVTSGGFHEIRRRAWKAGDVIELDLPMPVRLIEANPYVEETRNQVAVLRGPIVYCLESIDLPAGVRVLDVALSRSTPMTAQRSKELGGVTMIEGKGIASKFTDWSSRLYRDLPPADEREFHLVMIPYYAWDNRGKSEMTVWMPLAR